MPYAEQFESWIFDEIVPSVRKHGMYATDELINNNNKSSPYIK